MKWPTIVGYIAAISTTVAFIPQLIKSHKTRQTKDISFGMYLLFCFGLLMWTIYGIALKSAPIILANIVTLAMGIYILILKSKHG
ncbi:MAG: SemiSWEET transporter [Candidatus Omnitrophica bacterium]|nr:SemiSWEET transporter [Candidatus Omnitrophota bacterium]